MVLLATLSASALTQAQQVKPQPVTDAAAQASPLTPVVSSPVSDASIQASPIAAKRQSGPSILAHTPIAVVLVQSIDSGRLKQGQEVPATLAAPVAVHNGAVLPPGTPVVLTVVETVPAGRIMAQGEFSLQIVRVGRVNVYTDTLVFDGKPGHQDLPDSAPALGTDAGLPNGAPLTFHVQPAPSAAEGAPQNRVGGPGSVDGVANGGPPPPEAVKSTFDTPGSGAAGTAQTSQRSVSPADTTTNQQTQRLGQPSVAPNQPQVPGQTSPSPAHPQ